VQRMSSVCSLCPHASLRWWPLHSARGTRALPSHSYRCFKGPGTCRLKRDLKPTYMLTARDAQEEGAVPGGDGWQVATSVRSSPQHLACFTGLFLWVSLSFPFVRHKVDARKRR